jgi:hypothetical protein
MWVIRQLQRSWNVAGGTFVGYFVVDLMISALIAVGERPEHRLKVHGGHKVPFKSFAQ